MKAIIWGFVTALLVLIAIGCGSDEVDDDGEALALPSYVGDELIPPDSMVQSLVAEGGRTEIQFVSSASIEQVEDFYRTGLFGDFVFPDDDLSLWAGATWSKGGPPDGPVNVALSGSDGEVIVQVTMPVP